MSKVFLDTNILVYAIDRGQPAKQARAIELLSQMGDGNVQGVVSTQVLQEFYVVVTKKLSVDPLIAKALLHDFLRFGLVQVQHGHISEAIDCSILNRISFWDSLIVVCAESAACERVLTEDMNHGQVIRGVQIHNPFRSDRP